MALPVVQQSHLGRGEDVVVVVPQETGAGRLETSTQEAPAQSVFMSEVREVWQLAGVPTDRVVNLHFTTGISSAGYQHPGNIQHCGARA